MHQINHADILNAYLSRLTLGDLRALTVHAERWTQAYLNGNSASQAGEQAAFYACVCNAVNNITAHDLEIIERVSA